MSAGALRRTVLRDTGMTYGQLLRRMCVLRAAQSLADGRVVGEVASELGYRSVPMFVSMFKRTLGVTPGRLKAVFATASQSGSPARGAKPASR